MCAPINHILIFLTRNSDQNKKEKVNNNDIDARSIVVAIFSGFKKNGDITPAVNQAAATVFKNSDSALSWLTVKRCIFEYYTL